MRGLFKGSLLSSSLKPLLNSIWNIGLPTISSISFTKKHSHVSSHFHFDVTNYSMHRRRIFVAMYLKSHLQSHHPCIAYKLHWISFCKQLEFLKNQGLKPIFECAIRAMYPFIKKKWIEIKTMIYELKTILETKKIRVDCIDKSNAICIKTFQIKLAKVVTFNEGKGG